MFAGNFAPRNWALCNGQLLSISQNTALFSILGTFYGGNGTSNFALPNLQGRVPMHPGNNGNGNAHVLGEQSGSENVTLLTTQIPPHSHAVICVPAAGNQASPQSALPAVESTGTSLDYSTSNAGLTTMSPTMIQNTGGGQGHNNLQPYLCINFIIALYGIFPTRS